MHVEAFTEGKNLDAPDENEDGYVVVPGRLYAVMDGATDRTGRRYDGMLGGRLAARLIERELHDLAQDPGCASIGAEALVARLNQAFQAAYRRHGIAELARDEPGARICATLALAIETPQHLRFFLIGDSGLRLDGREIVLQPMLVDQVTGTMRRLAYARARAAGADPGRTEALSRALCWRGLGAMRAEFAPWFDEERLAALRADVRAALVACFPQVPERDLERLLTAGIIGAQDAYRNLAGHVLGYGCLDGFDVPPSLVRTLEREKSATRSVELFTDGYFEPPAGARVADWEAAWAEVERLDPAKVERWLSAKGTHGRIRADDRTVVILRRAGVVPPG